MFQPERGRENPVIRRAIDLYHQSGIAVIFHQDTVEVRFASNNKRFYPTWSQFLDDAAAIFGDRLPGGSGAGIGLDGGDPAKDAAAKPNGAANGAAAPDPEAEEKARRAAEAVAAAEAASQASEAVVEAEEPKTPEEQIRALRREVKLLKRAIKVVGMQREEWEREALNTRQMLESAREDMRTMAQNRTASQTGDRYRQLRQVLVRRLHPDAPGTPEEKRVREQIFKMIWKEVEHLDRQ